jgi:hypothetical protein
MAALLNDRGFSVAYVQVSKDYQVLNLKTERIRQWEAKAAARGARVDLFTPVAYMEENAVQVSIELTDIKERSDYTASQPSAAGTTCGQVENAATDGFSCVGGIFCVKLRGIFGGKRIEAQRKRRLKPFWSAY